MLGEVEEWRHPAPTGQLQVRLSQLVEERVGARLQRTDARTRRVLEQPGHEGDRLWWGAGPEHLQERQTATQLVTVAIGSNRGLVVVYKERVHTRPDG